MWQAVAAGIGGGSSLISSFINNAYARSESKRAWERDVKFWNMQNEYNTPANQMARLKEAGLNPNLIYGNITPGNSSSSVHATPAQQSIDFNAAGIIDNLLRWKKENEENKLLKFQNEQIQISNVLANAMFPWQEEQALQNARKSEAEAREAEVRAKMAEHDLGLLQEGLPSALTSSGDSSSLFAVRGTQAIRGVGFGLGTVISKLANPIVTTEERIRATKEYIKSNGMYGDYYPEVLPLIEKQKGGGKR